MRIFTRPRLLAGATLALALAGAIHYLGLARADERGGSAVGELRPASTKASNLITGDGGAQPQTMEAFLTDVTTDIDAYWEKVFAASDLPTPRVSYDWKEMFIHPKASGGVLFQLYEQLDAPGNLGGPPLEDGETA